MKSIIRFVLFFGLMLLSSTLYAFTFSPGDFIVAEQTLGIIKIDPNTGGQSLIASGGYLTAPRGVAFDSNGDLLVTNATGLADGKIIRINPATDSQSLISSGGYFGNLTDIVVEADGNLLVTVFDLGISSDHSGVVRVDPNSGTQTLLSSGGWTSVVGITLGTNGDIFVTDANGTIAGGAPGAPSAVVEVDSVTGAQTIVSSGNFFILPYGIVYSDGDLFVSDQDPNGLSNNNAVIKVVPLTGSQSILSSGGNLQGPFGITIDGLGDLIVTDTSTGAIIKVDSINGAQSVISSGGLLNNPIGITVAPSPLPITIANILEFYDESVENGTLNVNQKGSKIKG